MAEQEREKFGPFMVTTEKNLDPEGIICAMCEKKLSQYNSSTDKHSPSAEELYQAGVVPIPNFGWFCSQECADAYEQKFNVRFDRNAQGKVQYYP